MQIARSQCPCAPVQIFAKPALPAGEGEHAGQQHGRGNGSAFEVGHLVPALREALRGHVVSGQSADPAADEIDQHDPVPPPSHAGDKSECRWSDPERDDVRQRIQLAPECRMQAPPAGDTAIEPIKEESRRRHGCSSKDIYRQLAAHVQHAEQHGPEPARGIGQGQEVGQMKPADHREVLGTVYRDHRSTFPGYDLLASTTELLSEVLLES